VADARKRASPADARPAQISRRKSRLSRDNQHGSDVHNLRPMLLRVLVLLATQTGQFLPTMTAPVRAGNGFTEVLRALALNAQVGSSAHDPATRADLEAQLGCACAAARARGRQAVAARSRQLESLVLVDVARQRWDHSQPYMKDMKVTSGVAALHLHLQSQLVATVREAVGGCAGCPPLTTSCLLLAALEQLLLPAASVVSKLETFYTGSVPSRARVSQYVMDVIALAFAVWCLVAQASDLWCWLDPQIAALDVPLSFGSSGACARRLLERSSGASNAGGSAGVRGVVPAADTAVATAAAAPTAGDLLSVLLLEPMCRSAADALVGLALRTRTLLAHAAVHAAPAALLAALASALGASDCAHRDASAAGGEEGTRCAACDLEAQRAGSLQPLFGMRPGDDGRLRIEPCPLACTVAASGATAAERGLSMDMAGACACAAEPAEATSWQASGSASAVDPLAHGGSSAAPDTTRVGTAGDDGSAGDDALPAIFRAPLFVQLLAELGRPRRGSACARRAPVPATHVLAAARGVSDCLRRLSGGDAIADAAAVRAVREALQRLHGPGIACECEPAPAAGAGAAGAAVGVPSVPSLRPGPLSAAAVFGHASPPAASHAEVWRQLFAVPSDAAAPTSVAPPAPLGVTSAATGAASSEVGSSSHPAGSSELSTGIAADVLPNCLPAGCGSWPLLPALVQRLPTKGTRGSVSDGAEDATALLVAARTDPRPLVGVPSTAAELAQASPPAESERPTVSAAHQLGKNTRSPPPAYSWLSLHELCVCLSRRHELGDWDWPLLTPGESSARALLQPVLADLRRRCLSDGTAVDHNDTRSVGGEDVGSGTA
jgi:hypothetical protein